MNKIKNPVLFFILSMSALLILALASYTLSSPVGNPNGTQQEK